MPFFALFRIKPHAPPLVRVPVNSFEFHSCERTPQVECLMRLRRTEELCPRHPADHRLPRGLPGYLNPFAPHAFEPTSLCRPASRLATGVPPNIYAFHRYTRNSALPLRHSRRAVSMQSRAEPQPSHQTCPSAHAFTPSKSG